MPSLNVPVEFREERGRRLHNLILRDVSNRAMRVHRLATVRALYTGEVQAMVGPWEGASDIHLPVVAEKIDSVIPKIVNAFWATDPLVHVWYPPDSNRREEAKDEESFLNWSLRKDIPNFFCAFEGWVRDMLVDGVSILKPVWERSWRKAVQVRPVKTMYGPGDVTPFDIEVDAARLKTADEILAEIFGFGSLGHTILSQELVEGGDELVGQRWTVEFIEDRRRLDGYVEFRESEFVDEIDAYIFRHILERDSVVVHPVAFEDLIVPYRTRCLQKASRVTHQYWITRDEALRRMDSGEWYNDPEDRAWIEGRHPEQEQEDPQNRTLPSQKDMILGEGGINQREEEISIPDGYKTYDENKILVYEIYLRDDVDGDGEPTEVIYDMPFGMKKIMNIRYLDEEFPHGERPFVDLHYKRVTNRWLSRSMGEELYAINIEVNTIINHINNSQELINNPFFFYVPTAMTVSPEFIKGIRPGDGIPVGDINGVMFPKFMQEPLANLAAVDSMLLFADRLTISPMNAGSSQMRNAPRTARGTMTLVAEGNIKIDNIITRAQEESWGRLMNQISQLYGNFGGEEKWYRMTGQAEPQRLSMAKLRNKLDFVFKGNTVNTNSEVMRNVAQIRFNTLLTHPDYQLDPYARIELVKDFLNHWGEGADKEALIPKPPGQTLYTHPPMRQEDENESLARGVFVDVLPMDDDAVHLREMERFARTSRFEILAPEGVAVFAAHQRAHMGQLQAKMAQGAIAQGPGQGNNVPQGEVISGAATGQGMEALEGGVQ